LKALAHYLLLVGIPVLGILGVLQLGQGLTAPKAVAGTWTFEATRFSSEGPACAALEGAARARTFAVEQSGPELTLELGELRIDGHLDGNMVRTASAPLLIDASLEPSGTMRGVLSFPSCQASPTLAFTAARQQSRGAGGG
jgi:hypothetical protein